MGTLESIIGEIFGEAPLTHILYLMPVNVDSATVSFLCCSNCLIQGCKKKSVALKKAMVKKDVKSKMAAKKWL